MLLLKFSPNVDWFKKQTNFWHFHFKIWLVYPLLIDDGENKDKLIFILFLLGNQFVLYLLYKSNNKRITDKCLTSKILTFQRYHLSLKIVLSSHTTCSLGYSFEEFASCYFLPIHMTSSVLGFKKIPCSFDSLSTLYIIMIYFLKIYFWNYILKCSILIPVV